MSNTVTPAAPERFQSREQLDQYIEQQTATALEKAVGSGQVRVDRRVPWVTSGPVGQDSAGYSVLKAAAYALGFPPFSPLGLVVGRCHRSGLMAAGPAAG